MPCLDERATIVACIEKAREGLARSGVEGEVVVADNGSTDGSLEAADAAGARVVRVAERGYGHAYQAGITAARGEVIVIGDSDGTYDFSRLGELLRLLAEGADLALVSGPVAPSNPARCRGCTATSATRPQRVPAEPVLPHRRFTTPTAGCAPCGGETLPLLDLRRTGHGVRLGDGHPAAQGGPARSPSSPSNTTRVPASRSSRSPRRLASPETPARLQPHAPVRLLLAAMGLAVLALLAPGPITLFGRVFDYHFMFVGSLLGILGTQVASLGLFARALKSWPWWFYLERGLLTGTILFVTGLVVNIVIAVHWIESEVRVRWTKCAAPSSPSR